MPVFMPCPPTGSARVRRQRQEHTPDAVLLGEADFRTVERAPRGFGERHLPRVEVLVEEVLVQPEGRLRGGGPGFGRSARPSARTGPLDGRRVPDRPAPRFDSPR
jgi:hypothetical protein